MNFEWTLPTRIIFGLGRFSTVGKAVKGLGKRAYIVTSKSYVKSRKPVLDQLIHQLKSIGVEVKIFSGIEPNPRATTIDKAGTEVREFRPRYIVALGGGSVMDAAKCIALLAENSGAILDYAYKGPGKPRQKFNHALPLVCIPTVAATSSETDPYAVVTDWEAHKKIPVFGEVLQPRVSIIDPELTYSVPQKQTIDGAIDMITHVVEMYLSSSTPSGLQDRMTEGFVENVFDALTRVLSNPSDEQGRSQLSWCAAFALCGAFRGRDGSMPVHAIEHGLSGWNDMAHGRGLALLLPRMMAYDSKVIGPKICDFNRRVFGVKTDDPKKALNNGFVKIMREVGAWCTLTSESIDEKIIPDVTEHTLETSGVFEIGKDPYLQNIRNLSKSDIEKLLLTCKEDDLESAFF